MQQLVQSRQEADEFARGTRPDKRTPAAAQLVEKRRLGSITETEPTFVAPSEDGFELGGYTPEGSAHHDGPRGDGGDADSVTSPDGGDAPDAEFTWGGPFSDVEPASDFETTVRQRAALGEVI